MIEAAARLQGRMVQALRRERSAGELRPHRAELDTANKATELSDFSVCTTWGIKGKNLYLLGLLRKRLEYPALKRAVREQQSLFNASVVLIEDKASGTQLIQELITDGFQRVTRYQPDCDKIMRMHAQTAVIENGFVWIPETAPWLAEYLQRQSTCSNIWANHRRGMLLMH
jgi:predicted phage terminase large subunit-like protein